MDRESTVILNTDFVAVNIDDYHTMIRDVLMLDILKNAIFENASLRWDKKSLSFDDSKLSCMLQSLFLADYDSTLESLQEEEAKDGTDKD